VCTVPCVVSFALLLSVGLLLGSVHHHPLVTQVLAPSSCHSGMMEWRKVMQLKRVGGASVCVRHFHPHFVLFLSIASHFQTLKFVSCAGDSCPYSHGIFEEFLHPLKYRLQLCKERSRCNRRTCFFAHSGEELRQLPEVSLSVSLERSQRAWRLRASRGAMQRHALLRDHVH
jgi:hypothetical protein